MVKASEFLSGGGEMAALIRSRDWSDSTLGPPAQWPNSLKTVVRIMLDSRYAIWIGWGPDLRFLYNDAYRAMTLGKKHPWALGRPAREVWSEAWNDLNSRVDEVVQRGRATYDENLFLLLERSGYAEETYHTFSYSPLVDDDGNVGGLLCIVVEGTQRYIAERRLKVLREVAAQVPGTSTPEEFFAAIGRCLCTNPHDVPFGMIYLAEPGGGQARLVCDTGIDSLHSVAPAVIEIDSANPPWPIGRVLSGGEAVLIDELGARFPGLPTGAWSLAPREAVAAPLFQQGQMRPAGVLIIGLNPFRPFNDLYRGFINLLAGQIAAGLAERRAREEERKRAEALAEIDRAKTAFFSNASHEFRTPLTLMLGPLEDLLARNPDSNSMSVNRDEVEAIHRNGLRLLRLVNTLLDFSRIEAGRIQAIFEPVDLAAYTAELASSFRSAMEIAGLTYRIDCPQLPEPAYVDRDMWEKIVLNLISNAFKYTLQGSVAVALDLSADNKEAVLTVRDSGVGILNMNSRGCSSVFIASRARPGGPTKVPGLDWRWYRNWSGCTAER
ncbi:MAG TPA: histidine kinase dimerization/phospho-acceptor domain-containing protein [Candidatus Binataceae bacterium]|nr:histidine kinase dimerization/phospho-acceptor domain-containing protein [Candidatus Binataceae bacterium]